VTVITRCSVMYSTRCALADGPCGVLGTCFAQYELTLSSYGDRQKVVYVGRTESGKSR